MKFRQMRREASLSASITSTTQDKRFNFNALADKAILVAATFIFPGLGHVIIRRFARGALWMALIWIAIVAFYVVSAYATTNGALVLGVLSLLAIAILSAKDVLKSARISSSYVARFSAPARWFIGAALLGTAIFHPALRISALVFTPIFSKAYIMQGDSMSPTIHRSDAFIVSHLILPSRWDVIAYRSAFGKEMGIARIVGMPHDSVEIRGNEVFISGIKTPVPIAHDYTAKAAPGEFLNGSTGHPIKLAADEYFVVTDAPLRSGSRYWPSRIDGHQRGALPASRIAGVATVIFSPITHIKSICRVRKN
jgi:signal peptidase I